MNDSADDCHPRHSAGNSGGTAEIVTPAPTSRIPDADDGVSIHGTEQWVPETKIDELSHTQGGGDVAATIGASAGTDASAQAEHPVRSAQNAPLTPRRSSKHYPEAVRAALKSLRKSLFEALKKKAQANGREYVHALLLNAEGYTPPLPVVSSPQKDLENAPEAKRLPAATNSSTAAEAESPIGEDLMPEEHVMMYADDGVKAHTRTVRSSNSPMTMRMQPINSTPPKSAQKEVVFADDARNTHTTVANDELVGKPPQLSVQARAKPKAVYQLPPKWQIKKSASTQSEYYYNPYTGESTWRHPGTGLLLPITPDRVFHCVLVYCVCVCLRVACFVYASLSVAPRGSDSDSRASGQLTDLQGSHKIPHHMCFQDCFGLMSSNCHSSD